MKKYLKSLFLKKIFLITHCNDFTDKVIMNSAVMITLISFLFMISGCSYYRSVTRVNEGSGDLLTETINENYPEIHYPRNEYPESNLLKLFFMDYSVFAVDSNGCRQLTEPELINDTIYASVKLPPVSTDSIADIPEDGVSVRYHPSKDGDLLERIFIYTDTVNFIQGGKAYFSVNGISKIITLADHPAAKIGFTFLILGGILTITLVTLFAIAMSNFNVTFDK